MNCGNTYYFIDDCNDICKCKNGVQKEFSEKLGLLDLIDDINEIIDENEQLHSELAEKDIQLDFLKDENVHMRNILEENKELKEVNQELQDYISLLKKYPSER